MSVSYCADHLTDGNIPATWVNLHGTPKERNALIDGGLWQHVEDDYCIPDFLEHNLSRDVVEGQSKRGKEMADRRWEKRRQAKREAMRTALPQAMPHTQTHTQAHTEEKANPCRTKTAAG
jgi:hypothetical protein